ncbi:MAG: hypothetical protein AAF961_07820, partial [Planctomycetota bacterium]
MSRPHALFLIASFIALPAFAQDLDVPAGPTTAEAAKAQFDASRDAYMQLLAEIKEATQQRDEADGEQQTALEQRIAELRRRSHEIVADMGQACIAVYRLDSDAYPELNSTVLAFAQFYLVGDSKSGGDGGDQYAKALPLITGLLNAGAGDEWNELW